MKKKIFLICPVRNVDKETEELISAYIAVFEKGGHEVHYPARDTDQIDPTGGYLICSTNLRAIIEASEIHIWYTPSSLGTHFDLGMVFALGKAGFRKKIVWANRGEIKNQFAPSDEKNFVKVMEHLRLSHFEN